MVKTAARQTEEAPPGPGHNQPTARDLVDTMRHAANLAATNDKAATDHLLNAMAGAYRLREYIDGNDANKDELKGVLEEKVPEKRIFNWLLKKHAFHKGQLEKSRISRCAAALEVAWAQKVEADNVITFIRSEGGIVKCGRKASFGPDAPALQPDPIPLPGLPLAILMGHASLLGTVRPSEAGDGLVFLPAKALSPLRHPGRRRATSKAS